MMQIKKLTLTHKKDLRVILEDFQLVLNDGDKAVIIGEEGNGKSTLLKWMYDPALTEDYIESTGERIIGKERLGYLPQELPEAEKTKTVYEYFYEKEKFWDQTPKDLAVLARKFGLTEEFFYRDQQMRELSGGEKVKAQMMRLLMEDATVLLLDEPSNDIDLATLELLEKLIREWEHIVVFISHDETLIENTANMVIHIEQIVRKTKSRYTVAKLPYRTYVEERLQNFERQEQKAQSDRREKALRDEKYRKVYQSVQNALNNCSRQAPSVAKNLKDKMHTVKAMNRRFEKEDASMTEMPEQEEAIYFQLGGAEAAMPAGKTVIEYQLPKLETPDGERVLAENITLKIRGPEKICIVGPNGAGKTTLLKKIATELKAREDLRVDYMPQNYEDQLDLSMTPVDFLDSTGEKSERTKIRTYLGSLKYTADEMDHPIRELSGGQKRRVAVAGVMAMKPRILVLDEPAAGLDPEGRDEILSEVKNYHKKTGTTVLLVSHSMEDIAKYADRVLVMSNKKIAMYDTVEQVFARAPELLALGLSVPQVTKIFLKLREMGVDVPADVYTVPYAVKMILEAKQRRDAGESLVLPREQSRKGGVSEC